MKFNYTSEKKKFEKNWEKMKNEYQKAGMNSYQIAQIKQFDWELFKKERIYRRHNQFIWEGRRSNNSDNGQELEILLKKYNNNFAEINKIEKFMRYGWMNELQRKELIMAFEKMPEEYLELATLVFLEGYTQKEVARMLGISEKTVWRKIKAIKKMCLDIKNR